MKKIIVAALCLIALPCMAQYGYMDYGRRGGGGGAKTPEEQEATRQINETLQNIQHEMMALAQAPEMDLQKQKKVAEQLRLLDAGLKKYADPSGIQAAMTSLMLTLQGVGMQMSRTKGPDLLILAKNLKSIDADLAEAIGPEVLEKMRSGRKEGGAKGSLGALRSALSIYYGDKEGKYPSDPQDLIPKYLTKFPTLDMPHHKPTSAVRAIKGVGTMEELKARLEDSGQWLMVVDPQSKINGTVLIDCTHKDSRGVPWHTF